MRASLLAYCLFPLSPLFLCSWLLSLLSCVWPFATPQTAACQACLAFTVVESNYCENNWFSVSNRNYFHVPLARNQAQGKGTPTGGERRQQKRDRVSSHLCAPSVRLHLWLHPWVSSSVQWGLCFLPQRVVVRIKCVCCLVSCLAYSQASIT